MNTKIIGTGSAEASALAAQQSVPPDRDPVPFEICHKCSHEFEVVGGNDNSGFTSSFQNCPHCQTRNDTWIHIPLNPERHRKNSRNADYSKPLPGIPVPPEARAVDIGGVIGRTLFNFCEANVPESWRGEAAQRFFERLEKRLTDELSQCTCFPPGEGEDWAKALRDRIAMHEALPTFDLAQLDALLWVIRSALKHAPARPTAAREDTARLDDYVRALAWLEEHVSRGRGTLELGITEDGNIGIWINGFDKSDHAIGSGVDLYSAIDAAMQQGGKTP